MKRLSRQDWVLMILIALVVAEDGDWTAGECLFKTGPLQNLN